MSSNEMTDLIRNYWNETSDSKWYRSLRTDEKIRHLTEDPSSAFHPEVYKLIRKYLPSLEGAHILLPSSGDNHAALALALMGAHVTSADISLRQLENASVIADKLGLKIDFVCADTMKLEDISSSYYDMVYTSNGTLSWISSLDDMYSNICRVLKPGGHSVMYDIHPFNRPFSGEPWKTPSVVKSYHSVMPDMHWRVGDILNAQINAGLSICELSELPAVDASFWYSFDELQGKSEEELDGINDPEKNPMAALPAWLALVSFKN